jgi:hypothetical protein
MLVQANNGYIYITLFWSVVSTPPKNSQLGLFPKYGKIRIVPDHQPSDVEKQNFMFISASTLLVGTGGLLLTNKR